MRFMGSIFFMVFLGCDSEKGVTAFNSLPEVLITSHSDSDLTSEGYIETFRGSATDANHSTDQLLGTWYHNGSIICDSFVPESDGVLQCDMLIVAGENDIRLEVRDPENGTGLDNILLTGEATGSPEVSILSPSSTESYYLDQPIYFNGSASDLEDPAEDLLIEWSSDLDGVLEFEISVDSNGEFENYSQLTQGNHTISLRAEDTTGKVGIATVNVQVGSANVSPSCSITSPLTGAAGPEGELVTFTADVFDPDVVASTLGVTWESDKDGVLGNSTPTTDGFVTFPNSTLSVNTHLISLTVEDNTGAECVTNILYTVGTPPSITLNSPLNGDVFIQGDGIPFELEVSDNEDQPNEVMIEWSLNSQIWSIQGASSSGLAVFVENGLLPGNHTLEITATDTDGLFTTEMIQFTVDGVPTIPTLSLTPDPAYTTDALVAIASGSIDPEGAAITYDYVWTQNGGSTTYSSGNVPSSATTKNDIWMVRVTPSDGSINGPAVEESLVIQNTPPTVSSIIITPSTAVSATTTLTCTYLLSDPDEIPTGSISWSNQTTGVVLGYGATLTLTPTIASTNDWIECEVTATDGDMATGTGTLEVQVTNADPTISQVTISPSTPNNRDLLSCSALGNDTDGDPLTYTYDWMNTTTGQALGSGSTVQLNVNDTSPFDSIECTATASDPFGGIATGTDLVGVVNTDPNIDTINLSPTQPLPTDTLLCEATVSDDDGDMVSISFEFEDPISGQIYAPTSQTSSNATLDLNPLALIQGDIVACHVTATEPNGGIQVQSAQVALANSGPVFTVGAEITPDPAVMNDVLNCTSTVEDLEDGTLSATYTWSINGVIVSTGPTYTLALPDVIVGDSITCTALAVDSDGESDVSIDTINVDNTPPTISTPMVTPNPGVYNDTILTCSATVTDPDESLIPNYIWIMGGVQVGTGNTLDLATTSGQYQDTVICLAEATDSSGDSMSLSSSVTIENRVPNAPGLVISPTSPIEGIHDLSCTVVVPSVDDDGDTPTYTFEWTVNGSPYMSATNGPTTSTVSGAITLSGETWVCSAIPNDGISDGIPGSSNVTIQSDWLGSLNFTNCGATGSSGPTDCTGTYQGTPLEGQVSLSSGKQTWIVPSDGYYSIEAFGAKGGGSNGGNGAHIYGEFYLYANDVVVVLVGQMGTNESYSRSYNSGAGGGGSFVTVNGSPVIIAGGGGGCGADSVGSSGLSTETGSTGSAGQGGSTGEGNAGAGYNGNGPIGAHNGGSVSYSFTNGGVGGAGMSSGGVGYGGFGGGGGDGYADGGGGGGYSGGNTGGDGSGGSGAGSYNNGTNPQNSAGVNSTHGEVIIDRIP